MTFNPKQHITNMRGKDYLEVKWRLVWFREEHPTGRIETELVNHDPVLMRATIFSDDKCLATGYGTAKMQGVAKTRPYEGAETAAIGRALAHAGFGTQFTGEVEGDSLADAPVKQPPPTHGTAKERELFSTVVNSKNVPYSQVPKDKLSFMANAIKKNISKIGEPKNDEELAELEHLQLKLDAAEFYMGAP